MNEDIIPFIATHPGEIIKDELDCRDDLNQKILAKLLDVKSTYLNEVIKGKRPINADLSILLEKVLGISSDFWLKMQSQYDIDVARQKVRNQERLKNIEIISVLKNYVSLTVLKKRDYLTDSLALDLKKIFDIFDVNNLDELINEFTKYSQKALFRKSSKFKIDQVNLFTWSALSMYEARSLNVASFRTENIKVLIDKINEIFYKNKDVLKKITNIMSDFGIKLVVVPKLEQTPVDGMSFWSGENPAISLSLRYGQLDKVAFTLMHELGHIALHLSKNKVDKFIEIDGLNSSAFYEKEADEFARISMLSKELNTLLLKSTLSDSDVLVLSKKFKVHPAIIIGRHSFNTNNFAKRTEIPNELN